MTKQPAKINYFFGPGYTALWETIKAMFEKIFTAIKARWEDVVNIWHNNNDVNIFGYVFIGVLHSILAFSNLVFTTVLSLLVGTVCCIVHVTVVLLMMALVYIGFSLVWFADFVYRKLHGIVSQCSACQKRISLPKYVCQCGAIHTSLIPSKYGILKRTCECGRKLPTTFFNGRQKLQAICPHCGFDIANGGAQVAITFPTIGGPSAGKTCFINMAVNSLDEGRSNALGYNFNFVQEGVCNYTDNMQNIKAGFAPAKTNDMALVFYRFDFWKQRQKVKNLVSICDIGGEAYADADILRTQIGLANCQGFIVIVDPLSIEDYADEVKNSGSDVSEFNASPMSLDEILDMLLNTIDNLSAKKSDAKYSKPVAVVFTKLDIPGLEEKIGDTANADYRSMNPKATYFEAQNAITRQFLNDYNATNFLNRLDAKLTNVQFFSSVALAKDSTGAYYSKNTGRPLLWLLNSSSKGLTFDEKTITSITR